MKHLPYFALASILALSLVISACSDDEDNTVTPPQEYVADSSSFAAYKSWTQPAGPFRGADPAGLIGGAHASPDSTIQRFIYLNNNADRGSDGQFPVGTIFLKAMVTDNGPTAAITAMVKRGGDFNTAGGGWEYFFLDGNGSIQQRGETITPPDCAGCHEVNSNKDYIFVK